jgi:hypothetical protein
MLECFGRRKESCQIFALEGDVHPFLKYLRPVGFICLVFSAVQLGVGLGVDKYLKNVDNGAWWGVVCVFLAGASALKSQKKQWIQTTCLLSFFGMVTAIIGTIVDGMSSHVFRSLSGCGYVSNGVSGNDDDSLIKMAVARGKGNFAVGGLQINNSGDKKSFYDVKYCMKSYDFLKQLKAGSCYCVPEGGGFCGVYELGFFAKTLGHNCDSILKNYVPTVTASFVFCFLSLISVTILLGLSCVLACSEDKSLEEVKTLIPLNRMDLINSRIDSDRHKELTVVPEFGVSGTEIDVSGKYVQNLPKQK